MSLKANGPQTLISPNCRQLLNYLAMIKSSLCYRNQTHISFAVFSTCLIHSINYLILLSRTISLFKNGKNLTHVWSNMQYFDQHKIVEISNILGLYLKISDICRELRSKNERIITVDMILRCSSIMITNHFST